MSQAQNQMILVGKIGAPYGIKGWTKINTYTEIPEGIFDYEPWQLKLRGKSKDVAVTDWRRHGNGLIAKLASVDTRNDAEELVNYEIHVSAEQLPELSDDEFYWRDLEGMAVVNEAGYDFGKVSSLMETGSNDVLVVKANRNDAFGQSERLIPYLQDQVVLSVSKDTNTITVDWDPEF